MIPILILLGLGSLGATALSKVSLIIIYLSLTLGFTSLLIFLMLLGVFDFGHLVGAGDNIADSTVSDATLADSSHIDASASHDGISGLFIVSPFTFLSVGALFGAFGLITISTLNFLPPNIRDYLSIFVSLFLTFFSYFFIVRSLIRFLKPSSLAKSKMVFEGKEADIIEAISENGVGKAAIKIDNEVHYIYVRTEDGRPISIGKRVRIKKVIGDYGYVEEI